MLGIRNPAFLGAAAGFSPLSLSPALWLDAADTSTITASGSPLRVSQWNDKSGNGKNVTQGTGGAQPATAQTTLNGLNVLDFDGGDFLQAATAADWKFMHDGTKWIAAIVIKAGVVDNPNVFYDAISTVGNYTPGQVGLSIGMDDRGASSRNNASQIFTANGGASYQSLSIVNNVWTPNVFVVVSAYTDFSNATAADRSEAYVNLGGPYKANTLTGAASSSNPTRAIGIGGGSSTTNFRLVGSIGEVIVVSGANATNANRILLRDYLSAKWGL